MSIQMTAYINSSESSVVDKQLSLIGSYTMKPTDSIDIERPSFIINYSSELLQCNYIHVPAFERYYYAWIKTKPGGEAIIDCVSDPLKSFWTYIQNCDALITRSESVGAPTKYPDSMLPIYPIKKNVTSISMQSDNEDLNAYVFPPPMRRTYILTVIGSPLQLNGGE